jgi:hypothetical protein
MRRTRTCFGGIVFPLGVATLAVLVLLITVKSPGAQNAAAPKNGEALSAPPPVNAQAALTNASPKTDPEKSHLDQTKSDAAELSALAEQLRDELNKINVNVLSLDVLAKTEKLEKLAKKIKDEANAH